VDFGEAESAVRSVVDEEAEEGVPRKDSQEDVLDIDEDDEVGDETGDAQQARQAGVRRG